MTSAPKMDEKMPEHWCVQLRNNHPEYTQVKLKRGLPDSDAYTVVVVDSKKFMECYGREMQCYVLPPVPRWKKGKETGIREFLNPATGIPEMSRVSFEVVERKRVFGLFPSIKEGVVAFTNGRHRVVYMQYAGATSFPVEVSVSQAELLKQYCGS